MLPEEVCQQALKVLSGPLRQICACLLAFLGGWRPGVAARRETHDEVAEQHAFHQVLAQLQLLRGLVRMFGVLLPATLPYSLWHTWLWLCRSGKEWLQLTGLFVSRV